MSTYTCPFCRRVSHNANDALHKYCGACHAFEDDRNRALVKNATLWFENDNHGTLKGVLVVVSGNRISLGVQLEHPIMLVTAQDMALSPILMLYRGQNGYQDVFTAEPWKIYITEPATKLPTK